LKGRDMYADLESIEARGKRKKEKEKKEGFSLFGKKGGQEEPEKAPALEQAPEPSRKRSRGSGVSRKGPETATAESEPVREVEAEKHPAEEGPVTIEASGKTQETAADAVESESADRQEDEIIPLEERNKGTDVPDDISEIIPKLPSDYEAERKRRETEGRTAEKQTKPSKPSAVQKERPLEESRFYQRDIYAALDEIEQRGKRTKEKRALPFIKKEEPERKAKGAAAPKVFEPKQRKEAPLPMKAEEEPQASKPEPVPIPEREPVSRPEPAPEQEWASKQAPGPIPATEPESVPEPRWTPLSGKQLRKADEELLEFKRKLDKGFKSGKLTREQCMAMVVKKEIELGLRPPDEDS
jgi:hypothetical protein